MNFFSGVVDLVLRGIVQTETVVVDKIIEKNNTTGGSINHVNQVENASRSPKIRMISGMRVGGGPVEY